MVGKSKNHLGYTIAADGRAKEVFHVGANTWRNVVWSDLDCVIDISSGYRGGSRPAPFDVVREYAVDFPWKKSA